MGNPPITNGDFAQSTLEDLRRGHAEIARHTGSDIVMRDPAKARIAELERELQQLKRAA